MQEYFSKGLFSIQNLYFGATNFKLRNLKEKESPLKKYIT